MDVLRRGRARQSGAATPRAESSGRAAALLLLARLRLALARLLGRLRPFASAPREREGDAVHLDHVLAFEDPGQSLAKPAFTTRSSATLARVDGDLIARTASARTGPGTVTRKLSVRNRSPFSSAPRRERLVAGGEAPTTTEISDARRGARTSERRRAAGRSTRRRRNPSGSSASASSGS